jgi:hypothetical protein
VTTPHTARAHARLAPSAAYRWMECPGSVTAAEAMADKPSTYAAEGTAAHELAALCLTGDKPPETFLAACIDTRAENGQVVTAHFPDNERYFEVTEEMVEAVQLYVDTVKSLLPRSGEYELEVEQRLDMTHIHGEIFGTGDAVIYQPKSATLHVLDFKYGKGVPVEVGENPQLLLYGAGAARRYHNRRIEKVRLHIVQPRAQHHLGPVRSWETDPLTLMDFEDEIRVAASRAMADDAPRFAGDWCRFCKALPVCPAARERSLRIARQDFDESSEVVVSEDGEDRTDKAAPSPSTLSGERLAAVLKEAEFIGNWVKAVQEYAHSEAVAGRVPPGFKLVPKRAMRKWKGEPAEVHAALMLEGLSDDEIYTEREVRSPAQIEKVMGKKVFAAIESDMVVKVSSGTNLVLETDHRPAVKADAAADFVEN